MDDNAPDQVERQPGQIKGRDKKTGLTIVDAEGSREERKNREDQPQRQVDQERQRHDGADTGIGKDCADRASSLLLPHARSLAKPLARRLLHQCANPFLFGGCQLQQGIGVRPHIALVQFRVVAEP